MEVVIRYTREALRFGWSVMTAEDIELYGLQFEDRRDMLRYVKGKSLVYRHAGTGLAAIDRPVYEFM